MILSALIRLCFFLLSIGLIGQALCEQASQTGKFSALDAQVTHFLRENRHLWTGWNVPYEDGKILYDLVIKGRFKNILEIGTSTGHSTTWLAWAAAKTGGKVTT